MISGPFLSEYFPSYNRIIELQSPDSIRHILCWRVEHAKRCMEKADSVYAHNLLRYTTSRISAFDMSLGEHYPSCPHRVSGDYLHHVQCISLAQVYLVLAIMILVQAILLFKRRSGQAVVGTLMSIACVATIATTLWASADNNFARLMMPMFPCLCLLFACIVEQLNLRLKPVSANHNHI